MHELGKKSEHYHLKVLKFLLKNKANNYLMVGKFFYKYKNRFNSDKIKFLLNVEQLNDIVFNYVRDYNRIFIKGSNSINLQKTVDLISNKLVA
jgi:UDP-N-acetylmuramyl pentapeptide synthase